MANQLELAMPCLQPQQETQAKTLTQHVLIVGAGPSGVRFAETLLKKSPQSHVTLFGDEPYRPYNRVQLSALLAGDIEYDDIHSNLPPAESHPNFATIIARIIHIDTQNKCVIDQQDNTYPFDKLVIATGSVAHIPTIDGVNQTGVFTFRNLKDTEALYNRVSRSRHVVIVGGGLLGIEAAKALLRANTKVTLVQQAPRLMNRQLDSQAAELLQIKINALGINVITNSGVRKILGEGRVTGVVTRDGETIECDTVLLCAGIKPSTKLAMDAHIKVANGIKVDDCLRTSHEDIYAIGECCEHNGKTYGLVTPGFEQAAVLADSLSGGDARYNGSLEVSRLKVVGETVCSIGDIENDKSHPLIRQWKYNNKSEQNYRKVLTLKGKIIGANGVGTWPEFYRIQETFLNERRIYPWNILRFLLTGYLWGESTDDNVNLWPAQTIVCQCNNISQGELADAVKQIGQPCNVAQLSKKTGAGTTCGSCKPLLAEFVGQTDFVNKAKAWPALVVSSVVALLAVFVIAFTPALEVSDSVQNPALLQSIWHDKFWKQVTGFSMLGLSALGLLISLRKKINNDRLGDFAYWRVFHIALGVSACFLLITHTGLNLGENLNQWLMIDFLGILALGAFASLSVGLGHTMSANTSQRLKRFWSWAHIVVAWPLPILIAMHILTVYYF